MTFGVVSNKLWRPLLYMTVLFSASLSILCRFLFLISYLQTLSSPEVQKILKTDNSEHCNVMNTVSQVVGQNGRFLH